MQTATVQRILSDAVTSGFTAGANVLVRVQGEEVLYAEAGLADRENKVPICRDTIHHLYSMSKPITGAAVMKLVEEGLIDLLDPVSRYLPGFAQGCAAGREVTVFDLLGMTSGLPYPSGSEVGMKVGRVFDNPELTTIEFANALGRCGLEFVPGTQYLYGTSADVAGAVVEVAAGQMFGDFLADQFFTPLGMSDTGFWVEPSKKERLAKVYQETDRGLVLYTDDHLDISNAATSRPAFESGGAGLLSTLDDYMRFALMLLGNGTVDGVRVLSPRSVRYMIAPQLDQAQLASKALAQTTTQGHSYSAFLRVLTDEGQAYQYGSKGEYGWDGWLGAYFNNDPECDVTMVFLMSRVDSGTTRLQRMVKNAVYSQL